MFYFVLYGKNIQYFLSLNNLLEVSGQPQMVRFPLNHCTCIMYHCWELRVLEWERVIQTIVKQEWVGVNHLKTKDI